MVNKKKKKRKKNDICEVCKKKIGVKRITLTNDKYIHHGNYSIDRWKPNCADYLRERPREISDLVMGLYAKKKSLLNKIEVGGNRSFRGCQNRIMDIRHGREYIDHGAG